MPSFGWIAFDGLSLLTILICCIAAFWTAWGALGAEHLWDYYMLVLLFVVLAIVATGATNVLLFYIIWEVTAFAAWGIGRWASTGVAQTMMGILPLQGFGALGSLGVALALLLLALQNRSFALEGLAAENIGLFTILFLGGLILKAFALLSPAWYPSRDEQSFSVAHGTLGSAGILVIGVYPYLRLLVDNVGQRPEWRGPAVEVGLGIAVLLALAALGEDDLHKVLAYATFSQFGALIAFFAIVPASDTALRMLTVLAFTLSIIGLALCFGIVGTATGQRDMRKMGGLISRSPLSAALFLLCSFAVAALPPLGGFAGRLTGALTLLGWGESTAGIVFFALGLITLLYLLRVFQAVFLGSAPPLRKGPPALPRPVVATAGALALSLLFVGVLPGLALEILRPALEFALR